MYAQNNVAFFIARRYFFSKKKKNFINILTGISMIGVAVGTMALIVIMSAFNGLEELTRSLHSTYNPQLKISLKEGKSFEVDKNWLQSIKQIPHVKAVTEVIEDNALIRYGNAQMAVRFKGVSPNFINQYDLSPKLIEGKIRLKEGEVMYALIGIGVYSQLAVSLTDEFTPLVLWYPKRNKKISIDPLKSFNQEPIMAGGVLAIEQQFDQNTLIIPLEYAQQLTEYGNKRTSIEVCADNPTHLSQIQTDLKRLLGEKMQVLSSEEQQITILRAFKIERLFAFIALSFVIAISSFNIFFSLAMLAIEKRKDIAILLALGTRRETIHSIFLLEGAIIAFTGAISGLFLGGLLCILQEKFGFVGMGLETSVVSAYPIAIHFWDFVYVGFVVLGITFLASFVPALNASKVIVSENI